MRHLLSILLFLSRLSGISSAQNTIAETIFRLNYNQKYDSAQTLLQQKQSHINLIYFAVLDIDGSYWKNVTGPDTPNYEDFESVLEKYNPENAASDEEKIIQLITLSYRLRYQLKRFQFINAISTRKKTVELFDELKSKAGSLSPDQQELFSLYNALIVYFDNYLKPFWVNDKQANMDEAIQIMEKLSYSNQIIVQTLSSYFVAKIHLKYEKSPDKAKVHFAWLVKTYPSNHKFSEYLQECD
ncbi:hypothetical protein [Maribellus sediminis]|uniref:hypothetical protein n=1 Tax=Maribellus sediminis TaxID=2696285 RepID=UPI001430CBF0|nr:hypothetical protein [Maribellus sediminis]